MIEQYGEQFLERVFTATEIEYCNNRRQSTEQFA
ncbi:MAG: ACP synthase, partial [Pirellulales bacterium]|nr:ACP synthase [Pirellulales bacterium]